MDNHPISNIITQNSHKVNNFKLASTQFKVIYINKATIENLIKPILKEMSLSSARTDDGIMVKSKNGVISITHGKLFIQSCKDNEDIRVITEEELIRDFRTLHDDETKTTKSLNGSSMVLFLAKMSVVGTCPINHKVIVGNQSLLNESMKAGFVTLISVDGRFLGKSGSHKRYILTAKGMDVMEKNGGIKMLSPGWR